MRVKLASTTTLALAVLLTSSCGGDATSALQSGSGGATAVRDASGSMGGNASASGAITGFEDHDGGAVFTGGSGGMGGSTIVPSGGQSGDHDGGISPTATDSTLCRTWAAPAPDGGVSVDAICASAEDSVSSSAFCYPLVSSQNDSNTLFEVGLHCGAGLFQVTTQPTVKLVSGAATAGPLMASTSGSIGGTGFTLSVQSPPQDGDTITLQVDSTLQCAGGWRTVVTTIILAYCSGEQLWVGGSGSGVCNE